jgi:hypothetical protein
MVHSGNQEITLFLTYLVILLAKQKRRTRRRFAFLLEAFD